jgi:hypothetical protein
MTLLIDFVTKWLLMGDIICFRLNGWFLHVSVSATFLSLVLHSENHPNSAKTQGLDPRHGHVWVSSERERRVYMEN